MKFGYTIVYVPDVAASLQFFGAAFGLKTRFLLDTGDYGELETGETTLSFASHELGHSNFAGGHVEAHSSTQPLGIELAFVTADVQAGFEQAVRAGARVVAAPVEKPWGQTVAWVRCPDGSLVELCSPMAP